MKGPALTAALALLAPALAHAEPPATRTSTAAVSADDAELARYLEVLEEYELFERMEMVSLLAALEDEE